MIFYKIKIHMQISNINAFGKISLQINVHKLVWNKAKLIISTLAQPLFGMEN